MTSVGIEVGSEGVSLNINSVDDILSFTNLLSSPEFMQLSPQQQAQVLSAIHLIDENALSSPAPVNTDSAVPSKSKQASSTEIPVKLSRPAVPRKTHRVAAKRPPPRSTSSLYVRGFAVWFACAVFGWLSIPTQLLPIVTHAAGLGFFLLLVTSRTRWLWAVVSGLAILLVLGSLVPQSWVEWEWATFTTQVSGYSVMAITLLSVFCLCKCARRSDDDEEEDDSANSNIFFSLLMRQQSLLLDAIDKNRLMFMEAVEAKQEAFRATLTRQRDVLQRQWHQQLELVYAFAREHGVGSDESEAESDEERALVRRKSRVGAVDEHSGPRTRTQNAPAGSGLNALLPVGACPFADSHAGAQTCVHCDRGGRVTRFADVARVVLYLCWQGVLAPLRPLLLVTTVATHLLLRACRHVYHQYLAWLVALLDKHVWRGLMLGVVVGMYVAYVRALWDSLTRDIDEAFCRSDDSDDAGTTMNTLPLPAKPTLLSASPRETERRGKSKAKKRRGGVGNGGSLPSSPVTLTEDKDSADARAALPSNTPSAVAMDVVRDGNALTPATDPAPHSTPTGSTCPAHCAHCRVFNFLPVMLPAHINEPSLRYPAAQEALSHLGISLTDCACAPGRSCAAHSSFSSVFPIFPSPTTLATHTPPSLQWLFGVAAQHRAHTPQLSSLLAYYWREAAAVNAQGREHGTPPHHTPTQLLQVSLSLPHDHRCAHSDADDTAATLCEWCQLERACSVARGLVCTLFEQLNTAVCVTHRLHAAMRVTDRALMRMRMVATHAGAALARTREWEERARRAEEERDAVQVFARQQSQRAERFNKKLEKHNTSLAQLRGDVEYWRSRANALTQTLSQSSKQTAAAPLAAPAEQARLSANLAREHEQRVEAERERDVLRELLDRERNDRERERRAREAGEEDKASECELLRREMSRLQLELARQRRERDREREEWHRREREWSSAGGFSRDQSGDDGVRHAAAPEEGAGDGVETRLNGDEASAKPGEGTRVRDRGARRPREQRSTPMSYAEVVAGPTDEVCAVAVTAEAAASPQTSSSPSADTAAATLSSPSPSTLASPEAVAEINDASRAIAPSFTHLYPDARGLGLYDFYPAPHASHAPNHTPVHTPPTAPAPPLLSTLSLRADMFATERAGYTYTPPTGFTAPSPPSVSAAALSLFDWDAWPHANTASARVPPASAPTSSGAAGANGQGFGYAYGYTSAFDTSGS